MKHLGELVLTALVCGALGALLGVLFGGVGDWLRPRLNKLLCSHEWRWEHGHGYTHASCKNCGAEEWIA